MSILRNIGRGIRDYINKAAEQTPEAFMFLDEASLDSMFNLSLASMLYNNQPQATEEDNQKPTSGSSKNLATAKTIGAVVLSALSITGTGCDIDRSQVIFTNMNDEISNHVNTVDVYDAEGNYHSGFYNKIDVPNMILPEGWGVREHQLPPELDAHLRDSLGPAYEDSLRDSHDNKHEIIMQRVGYTMSPIDFTDNN